MTELSSEDFMKLSIQDVADLLMDHIHKTGKDESSALLKGTDDEGNVYSLKVGLTYD